MAGPRRSPARNAPGGLAPHARPPGQWSAATDYGYRRPARRTRRTATGVVIGTLGAVAALFVVAVLGFWLAGGDRSAGAGANGTRLRAGSKAAALSGPLYRSGSLPRVECRLPKIAEHHEPSMRRFLDTLSDCLDDVWVRQFAKAKVTGFTAPHRVFWSLPGSSPCGSYPSPGASAFYCPVNDTMYVGLSNVVDTAGGEPVSHYGVYARVIAHEYGHHVQEDAGILEYGHDLMATEQGAASAQTSRRIELQAQCFAGAFLSAERHTLPMTSEQYREMVADNRARGDNDSRPDLRDHGSGRHYAGWVVRGYKRSDLSACDTWTVSPSDVS